jgi:hypothetical protein
MFATFDEAAEEVRTSHLPSNIEHAIAYYRDLIQQYHVAILTANFLHAQHLNDDAHDLAVKLNAGQPGIMAHENAPVYVLQRATEGPIGSIPLWGQTGDFVVEPQTGLRVRIKMDGIFGIGADPVPGFSAHVVDRARPFISATGYRSFLGFGRTLSDPGVTVDVYVCDAIHTHIAGELKGRLPYLDAKYRSDRTT